MAMATTVTGSALSTSTAVLQKHFLGAGLRPQHAKAVHSNLLRSISAKLEMPVMERKQLDMGRNMIAGALFAALANVESATAAQQVLELAAENDNRGLALLIPIVPALGWVLYNILQPGLNQLNRMRNAKGIAVGLGLGGLASLALSPHASAAQEIAEIAENDSRGLLLLGILIPALGWVLFNILQPGLNQLNRMRSSKGIVGALGLGAGGYALFAPHADAAQEIATIAEGDNRGFLLLLVIAPAIGWVLFNILQPALNQLNRMRSEKK